MESPHDHRAEQAVLGALALYPEIADDIRGRLQDRDGKTPPDAFFDPKHQALFEAMLAMASRREPVDRITVGSELQRTGGIQRFKSRDQAEQIIDFLVQHVPGRRNYDAYAQIVGRCWAMRRVQKANFEIAAAAGLPETEIQALLMTMQQESIGLLGLADYRPTQRFGEVAEDVLDDAVDRVAEAKRLEEGGILGLPTGIPGLTELIAGLRPATLTVIGARPGEGKSTLMMQMAAEIARTAPSRFKGDKSAGGALIVSIEMTARELVAKVLFGEANVDSHDVNMGELTDDELLAIETALEELRDRRIFIADMDAPSWPQIRARIIIDYEKHGVEAVFIDYLQKIPKPARVEKKDHVTEIVAGCKSLAKQIDIPVIGLAQLKRPPGRTRKMPRPTKEDFGESSAIEKDADLAILLYPRGPRLSTTADATANLRGEKRHVEEQVTVIVDKHRGGRTGDVHTIFNKTLGRFTAPPSPAEQFLKPAPEANRYEREQPGYFDIVPEPDGQKDQQ